MGNPTMKRTVLAESPTRPTHSWGRLAQVSWLDSVNAVLMLLFSPSLVLVCFAVCKNYDCSFTAFIRDASDAPNLAQFVYRNLPQFSPRVLALYLGWVVAQGLLYRFVPGKLGHGQRTPAGHLLPYTVNGWNVWLISHFVFFFGAWMGLYSPSIIVQNWEGGLVAANMYGYGLTMFAYVKAHVAPSHPRDRKFSGSVAYDLFMGIEFNPRFGELWDFKLFHNGRPGIIAWTLINASFAAAQYERLGRITNSMMIVNFLQALYVLDFFWHEDWYLRTIDIAHDHFGFYLAWGDTVWLPFMYTLQAQYCYATNVELPAWATAAVFVLGLVGYAVFRKTNNEKDLVRRTDGECTIWGEKAEVIRTTYVTSDGKTHRSLLLVSGCWGLARQFNYMGDLSLSLAMCLACGINHLLPYFYIIFMFTLLNHRIIRSEFRCRDKYGSYWTEYCKRVRWRLCPLIY